MLKITLDNYTETQSVLLWNIKENSNWHKIKEILKSSNHNKEILKD